MSSKFRNMSEAVTRDLLETDLLTTREPSDGIYTVHEDDVPQMVRAVLAFAASRRRGIDSDPASDHDPDVYMAVEAEQGWRP